MVILDPAMKTGGEKGNRPAGSLGRAYSRARRCLQRGHKETFMSFSQILRAPKNIAKS
jgi:hypothetical protein